MHQVAQKLLLMSMAMLYGISFGYTQANVCNSNALAPVFKQDFGQALTSTSTSQAKPGSTNYSFGNVGTDGNYIITPLVQNANKNDWTKGGDHTGNSNGNMFLVNAGGNNSVFFRDTAYNLCEGSIFNFTAWVANVNTSSTQGICGGGLVYPKVTFNIKDINGNILNTITTGAIPLSPVNGPPNWQQYGFQFSLPTSVTTVIFEMVDSYGGGSQCGNDLALDDILFTACTPQATISLKTSANVCSGSDAIIVSSLINNPFVSPVYQFQRSFDGGNTWLNIGAASSTNDTLIIPNASVADNALYRALIGPNVASLSGNTCITASNSISFAVNPLPSVTISNNVICEKGNLNITANASGGSGVYSNYYWTGPKSFTSSIASPIINNADSSNKGLYSVKVTDSKGCSATATKTIYIDTLPIVKPIAGDSSVCVGKTINLTDSVTGGVWSSSNNTIATVNNSGQVSGNSAGNILITYTVTNSAGCTTFVTKKIYVNSLPVILPIIGNTSYCSNEKLNLIDSTNGGIWSSSNTSAATIDSSGLVNIITAGSFTASYSITNNFGCLNTVTKNITINPVVILNNIQGDSSVCVGRNLQLSNSSSGGNWTSNNVSIATVDNNGLVKGIADGTAIITYSLTNSNGCASSVTKNIYVHANPIVLPIIGNASVCSNEKINLIDSTNGGVWGSSNSAIATIDSSGLVNIITAGSFTAMYSVSNSFGCLNSVAKNITVNPSVILNNILGDSSVCVGKNLQLSNTTNGGNWSSSNSSIATVDNNGLVKGIADGTAIITYNLSNGFGCSSTVTKNIHVHSIPILLPIIGNASYCSNEKLNLIDSTNGGIWSSNNTAVATIDSSGLVNIETAGSFTATYSITNNFGCSASISKTIIINPSQVISLHLNNDTICTGNNLDLPFNNSIPGTNFAWTSTVINGNVSGNTNNNPANNINAITDHLINQSNQIAVVKYVISSVNNTNCTNSKDSALAFVYPLSTAPDAGFDRSLCLQDSIHLNGNIISNGTGSWSQIAGPNTVSFSDIHSPKAIVTNLTNGKYSFVWMSSNNICSAASDTMNVIIYENVKASFATNISNSICNSYHLNAALIYATNLQNQSATYQWYLNDSLISNSSVFPDLNVSDNYDSAIIKLKAISLFGCKNDSITKSFSIIHKPTPDFNLNANNGCAPLNISFNNTSNRITNYSFEWNFGNGQISQQVQPGNIVFAGSASGKDTTYLISLKAFNQCDTVSIQKTITVRSKAKTNFKANILNNCSPMIVGFNNNSMIDSSIIYRLNFGSGTDSIISATAQFNYTYHGNSNAIFNAVLTAANACGTDSTVIPLSIMPNANIVNILAKDSASCNNSNSITFINNTTGAKNFIWNFGDGTQTTTTQSPDNLVHNYGQTGSYSVSVLIHNDCSDTTVYRKVFVYPVPKIGFISAPSDLCIGDSVHFINTSDSLVKIQWNFGDGIFSSLNNPSHNYQNAGKYTIWLKGTLQYPYATCYDSANTSVTIISHRKGYMQISDSAGNCIPFKVVFINRNGPSLKTNWDFGDGTTGAGDTITHTYLSNGNYKPTMTSLSVGGCTFTDTVNISVKAPTGSLQSNNVLSCISKQVNFTVNTNYTDSVQWDFGDGVTAITAAADASHIYTKGGSYFATISLRNSSGCMVPLAKKDTIRVEELKADAKVTAVYDCGKTTFNFKDSSHSLFGIYAWTWITNTTDVSHQQNISKTFVTEGKSSTSLIIQNTIGCSDTVKADYDVLVYQFPKANIESIGDACRQVLVNFSSDISSRDSIVALFWNFGNGITAKDSAVKVMYYADGNYGVKLVVSTVNNCYDSAYKAITVHPTPTVVITGPNAVCKGDSAILNASGTSNYIWKDQNNNILCSNCSATTIKPTTNASYQVIGYSEFGCSDVKTTSIKVIQPFAINASPNDSLCIGSEKILSAKGADNYTWYPANYLSSTTTAVTTTKPLQDIIYHVIGRDNYGCFADTATIKIVVGKPTAINIGLDTVLQAGSIYQFNPHYSGAAIKNWNWTGSKDLSCTTCETPTLLIKKDICIICNTTNTYNCPATDTACVKVFCPSSEIFVPNAFSPDGDGINDKLIIQGKGISIIKSFRIFSRWGELVFERTNFSPGDPSCAWDGKVRGKPAEGDVFVYVCEVLCDAGYPAIFKGNTAILK